MSESQRYTDDQKHVDPIYGLKEDLATAGCKLPMELRSFTCRSYVCKHSKKGSTWAER